MQEAILDKVAVSATLVNASVAGFLARVAVLGGSSGYVVGFAWGSRRLFHGLLLWHRGCHGWRGYAPCFPVGVVDREA